MSEPVLLSTAYLPPAEYFRRISEQPETLIEKEENYLKQTYRNRCYIMASNGIQALTVPVLLGSFHKTRIKDCRIDYSKRWQQVHAGALKSAYANSPYYLYYIDEILAVILKKHEFLLDLNTILTELLSGMAGLKVSVSFTGQFIKPGESSHDHRYTLTPKINSGYRTKPYIPVFDAGGSNDPRLSIIDLIFSTGPDAASYL
jgi:hypothetical protein